MLRLPDMFFSSTTLGIQKKTHRGEQQTTQQHKTTNDNQNKKKHEHINWQVLNPQPVAHLLVI